MVADWDAGVSDSFPSYCIGRLPVNEFRGGVVTRVPRVVECRADKTA